MEPGAYKTQSERTKKQVTLSYRNTGFRLNEAPSISPICPIQPEWDLGYTKQPSMGPGVYWRQVRGKRNGVPENWFPCKEKSSKFANWPNAAGMGPGVHKTRSKHTKNKLRYRTALYDLTEDSKPMP